MYKIAKNFITKFGGAKVVADARGVDVATVYKWTYPKERGGTGGLIPAEHQQPLLDKAIADGKDITPYDFFEIPKKLLPTKNLESN